MILFNSIPFINNNTAYYNIPVTNLQRSVFTYMPFGNTVGTQINIQTIKPTPQGISTYTNPFLNWFNFTMPNFSNFRFPTFNFSNALNNITTTTNKIYNTIKQTASNTWEKVSSFSSRIVANAKKYLGYNEKDGSYKKFTGGKTEPKWCAYFATSVARESGANIPHFSSVSQIMNWGKNKLSKKAKVGDLIIFKGKDSKGKQVSHTGIVSKVENGRVYTIEGNTSNKVANRSYLLNDSRITGYITVA